MDQAFHFESFVRAVHRRMVVLRALERVGICLLGGCVILLILMPILIWRGQATLELVGAALGAGANCVHGTALGVGERVGNTQMDQILVNLKLMGVQPWAEQDVTKLKDYCLAVSRATGVPIPKNYPVMGDDAFRTATGVHAAAVIKAYKKGDIELANSVYSGVPSHYFGLEQIIEIGPMSGKSNVVYWLERRGIAPSEELVELIFQKAKSSDRCLTEEEVLGCCQNVSADMR